MSTILIVYASKHGSTREIAERIAKSLQEAQHDVTLVDAAKDTPNPRPYDAVILGSAVYAGRWRVEMKEYCELHASQLIKVENVWLFSSGPVGKELPKETDIPRTAQRFIGELQAIDHTIFHGKIDPQMLSFGERAILKAVKADTGDFRDWDAIDAWTKHVSDTLVSQEAARA